MFSIIKPRGDIKSNWESVNPVLRLREWGVEWETSIGIGEVKVKIGDGITHWNDLDYSVTNDVTKKIVKTFATIPENQDNPSIEPGASLETLFGQVKRKFDYTINFMTALKNMVGDYQSKSFNTGSGTVTASDLKNAIDVLEQYKLTTANILDVNDSTNTMAALSANQGRLLKEQVTTNTSAIDLLNSNLGTISSVSVNIRQITGVSLSAAIKNSVTHGKANLYAFWNVSENPFSFDAGYCIAFYNRSVSPSIYLIGYNPSKMEIATSITI